MPCTRARRFWLHVLQLSCVVVLEAKTEGVGSRARSSVLKARNESAPLLPPPPSPPTEKEVGLSWWVVLSDGERGVRLLGWNTRGGLEGFRCLVKMLLPMLMGGKEGIGGLEISATVYISPDPSRGHSFCVHEFKRSYAMRSSGYLGTSIGAFPGLPMPGDQGVSIRLS